MTADIKQDHLSLTVPPTPIERMRPWIWLGGTVCWLAILATKIGFAVLVPVFWILAAIAALLFAVWPFESVWSSVTNRRLLWSTPLSLTVACFGWWDVVAGSAFDELSFTTIAISAALFIGWWVRGGGEPWNGRPEDALDIDSGE
jgi:hypothetical protein